MARKRYTVEQIIGKLREAEIANGKGLTVPQAARQIEVAEQTYYSWRNKGATRVPRSHSHMRRVTIRAMRRRGFKQTLTVQQS